MRTWFEQLRDLRRSRNLTTSDLATSSGMSQASIRSYESGRRHPSRQRLSNLLECLGADEHTRNLMLRSAGYAPDPVGGTYAEPNLSEREAVALIAARHWPAFLLNQRADVLGGNDVGRRLLGLPPAPANPRRGSVLELATRRDLAVRCLNWDGAMAAIIGEFKAGNPEAHWRDTSSPAFIKLLDAVCAGDSALAARFIRLWEQTPAWEGGYMRQSYETV